MDKQNTEVVCVWTVFVSNLRLFGHKALMSSIKTEATSSVSYTEGNSYYCIFLKKIRDELLVCETVLVIF